MVHASAPLLGQGVHGLEHVGGLERLADQGEDSQLVEGEGLLEPFIETGESIPKLVETGATSVSGDSM